MRHLCAARTQNPPSRACFAVRRYVAAPYLLPCDGVDFLVRTGSWMCAYRFVADDVCARLSLPRQSSVITSTLVSRPMYFPKVVKKPWPRGSAT